MAQYDAGSIDATLRVNEDAFDQGLRHAQEKARQFEDEHHSTSLGLNLNDEKANEELRQIRARLAELSDDGGFSVRADIEVDDAHAREEIDALRARMDEIRNKDVTVRVHTEEARSEVDRLAAAIGHDDGGGGGGGDSGGGGGGLLKSLGGMVAKFGLLGTLGGGIINPLLGEVLGLGGAAAIAGVGVGAFGLTAKSAFTTMQTDTKAVTAAQLQLTNATTNQAREKALVALAAAQAKITGPMKDAVIQQQRFNGVLATFKAQTADTSYSVIGKGYSLIGEVLSKAAPIANAAGRAIGQSLDQIKQAASGPGLTNFFHFIQTNIGPVIHSLTGTLMQFAGGFAKMFENSMPLINAVLGQLNKLATGFNHLTGSPAFAAFMSQLADDVKLLTPVVGDLFTIIGHLLVAIQPLVAPTLEFLHELFKAVDALLPPLATFFGALAKGLAQLGHSGAITELGSALGKLLDAVTPLLGPIFSLVSSLLPGMLRALSPIITAIHGIVQVVGPMVSGIAGLINHLGPLKDILGGVVDAFIAWKLLMKIGWISTFVEGIAEAATAAGGFATMEGIAAAATAVWDAALGLGATVMAAFGVAVDVALGPVGLIILAIAALAFGLYELITHWKTVNNAIKDFLNMVGHGFVKMLSDVGHIMADFLSMVGHAFVTLASTVGKSVVALASAVGHGFVTLASDVGHIVVNFVSWVGHQFADLLSTIGHITANIALVALHGFENLASWVGHTVVNFVSGIGHDFANLASSIGHAVANLASSVLHGFENLASSVGHTVAGLVSSVVSFFGSLASRVISAVGNLVSGVVGWFKDLPGKIIGAIGDAYSILLDVGKQIVHGLWDGIKGVWNDMTGWIGHAAHGIAGFLKNPLSILSPSRVTHEIGRNITQGLWNGIKEPWGGMTDWLTKASGDIAGSINTDANYTLTATAALQADSVQKQTDVLVGLDDHITKLHQAVTTLAADTGTEVGKTVGLELDKAVTKSSRLATEAKRKGA